MMDDEQREDVEKVYKKLIDSMDELSPARQMQQQKTIADIRQLLLADNALRAGDQKLFNYIMGATNYSGGGISE